MRIIQVTKLQKCYNIEFIGNTQAFAKALETQFPHLFTEVIKREKHSVITCYQPNDYGWWCAPNSPHGLPSSTTCPTWWLRKIEADKAWDITKGSSDVKVAIIDTWFDINHPDLNTQFLKHYDPYSNVSFDSNPNRDHHGTSVAGFVAVKADGGGAYLGVGFNTKMLGYYYGLEDTRYIERAQHAALVENVAVLTTATGWCINPGYPGNAIEKLAVKEILNHGTTIIVPAGNGDGGGGCYNNGWNQRAMFPLSPEYDERVIVVTSRDINDNFRLPYENLKSHSYFRAVDLTAPGWRLGTLACTKNPDGTTNSYPYSGAQHGDGTSFAAPIVAGVAALMKAANPCLRPSAIQDILKETTDVINDATDLPGLTGTGRVNAFKAVQASKDSYKNTLDLYIKDTYNDFGYARFYPPLNMPYHYETARDKSPNIWVRNQDDGLTNRSHQEPEYSSNKPVYIYVKIHNKSCVTSSGSEKVSLYWSKASKFFMAHKLEWYKPTCW